MKRETLYENALRRWGVESQIDMLLEEMSELQLAILKSRRDMYDQMEHDESSTLNPNQVAEEVADVEIMLEQVKQIYDIKKEVYLQKRYKKRRLAKRLSKVNNNANDF